MARQVTRQIKEILASNIKAAREAEGLTQLELGRRINGGDGNLVSRWERGYVAPSDKNMQALAALLDRPVAWFYTDHELERAA